MEQSKQVHLKFSWKFWFECKRLMNYTKFNCKTIKFLLKTKTSFAARISLAKQEAGNSMIRYQQVVFPLCTEIQLSVIAQFGFQPDGEGIIQVCKHQAFKIVLSVRI